MDAIEITLEQPIDRAEPAVREALAAEGFGVLTEIDVAAVLQAKLGLDRSPLKILGACNPPLARRALEIDSSFALVLPCNVVLDESIAGQTRVSIADPRQLVAFVSADRDDSADSGEQRPGSEPAAEKGKAQALGDFFSQTAAKLGEVIRRLGA
jgi:uncharacterized protein (DUF302 family)